jgi:hypothetical protein
LARSGSSLSGDAPMETINHLLTLSCQRDFEIELLCPTMGILFSSSSCGRC